MTPFTTHTGIACPLGMENVDTDQLIPARFMSRPRAAGYGQFLLHDLRFTSGGSENAGFILTNPRYAGASVMVARRNFGSGSSREAAVYALKDFGIACVLAPSFGDIFASNAVKNGVLPAEVEPADAEALLALLETVDPPLLTIDLEACVCRTQGRAIRFSLDPVRRLQLLNGWDDYDLTIRHRTEIARFAEARRTRYPWMAPRAGVI